MGYYKVIKFITVLMIAIIAQRFAISAIIDPKTGEPFAYESERSGVAPVVDGFLDDPAWKIANAQNLEWDMNTRDRWRANEDFNGKFVAVWHNDLLYLAFQLADDHFYTQHVDPLRHDGIELYIDTENREYKSDQNRFIIPIGKNRDQSQSSNLLVAWSADLKTCEISFDLKHTPTKGDRIGFSVYYNDNDGGKDQNRIGWPPIFGLDQEELLAELVFTVKIQPSANLRAVQWGRIKRLF